MFKIALIGSMSVGKTTLFQLLSQSPKFKDFSFLDETAMAIIRSGGIHPVDMDDLGRQNFQLKVYEAQVNNEKNAIKNNQSFITDRSILDGLAYSWEFDNFQTMFELTRQHLEFTQYTHIFYLPIEFGFDNSDRSVEDQNFQKLIDTRLLGIVQTLDQKIIPLKGNSLERCEQIVKSIFG